MLFIHNAYSFLIMVIFHILNLSKNNASHYREKKTMTPADFVLSALNRYSEHVLTVSLRLIMIERAFCLRERSLIKHSMSNIFVSKACLLIVINPDAI